MIAMRSKIVVLIAAILAVVSSQQSGTAAISGTPHDFSGKGWGSTELCVFCHTPHFSQTSINQAPLWSHSNTVVSAYTLYSSTSMSATLGQPSGQSKICLSCHDGTVAVDSFAVAGVMRNGSVTMSTTNRIGASSSLATDHPVSFTYDSTLAGSSLAGLATPSSTTWVDAGHTVPLFAGKLECGSCHEPHNDTNGKFLRISNAGSALCIKCHATK